MQIPPGAEPETVERVYRMLGSRYGPDHPAWKAAVLTLSVEQRRTEYDAERHRLAKLPIAMFLKPEFSPGIAGERYRRMGILCLLYRARRGDPDHAGHSILDLERLMSCPREHLLFTIWYLQEHQWIRQDEASGFAITGSGADLVEQDLPSYPLLKQFLQAAEEGRVVRQGLEGAPVS